MLVRGPWALSSAVTATKHRLGYVIIILYHWWYFNWGGGAGPPGYAYAFHFIAFATAPSQIQDFKRVLDLICK